MRWIIPRQSMIFRGQRTICIPHLESLPILTLARLPVPMPVLRVPDFDAEI